MLYCFRRQVHDNVATQHAAGCSMNSLFTSYISACMRRLCKMLTTAVRACKHLDYILACVTQSLRPLATCRLSPCHCMSAMRVDAGSCTPFYASDMHADTAPCGRCNTFMPSWLEHMGDCSALLWLSLGENMMRSIDIPARCRGVANTEL